MDMTSGEPSALDLTRLVMVANHSLTNVLACPSSKSSQCTKMHRASVIKNIKINIHHILRRVNRPFYSQGCVTFPCEILWAGFSMANQYSELPQEREHINH